MAKVVPWARVTDADGARQAVRMAGLPVFLLGLVATLTAGLALLTVMASGLTITAPAPVAIALVVGVALIGLGLALRACKSALVPLAAALTLANAGVTLWIAPLWLLPLQAMMVLVAMSGLRGWWWLRNHPA